MQFGFLVFIGLIREGFLIFLYAVAADRGGGKIILVTAKDHASALAGNSINIGFDEFARAGCFGYWPSGQYEAESGKMLRVRDEFQMCVSAGRSLDWTILN